MDFTPVRSFARRYSAPLSVAGALAAAALIAFAAWPEPAMVPYTLKKNDGLKAVGEANCYPDWQLIIKDNRAVLEANAARRCKNATAHTYYCNEDVKLNGESMFAASSAHEGDVILLRKDIVEACPTATVSIASR